MAIGSVWGTGTWGDDAWGVGTWGDVVPVAPECEPVAYTYVTYDDYLWKALNSIVYKTVTRYDDYKYFVDEDTVHVHKVIQSVNSIISNMDIHVHKVIKKKLLI